MSSLLKKMYRPIAFDTLFALVGIASLAGLYYAASEAAPVIEAAADPMRKGLALLAALLTATLFACLLNRFEQRLADDFTFQTLSKSSMIAIFAFVFSLATWDLLFRQNLGQIPPRATVALLISAWSLAYFYTRIRGTRA